MTRKMCILVLLLLVVVPLCEQALMNITTYTNKRRTWNEAQNFCRTRHTDLVTIRNEEENQQLNGRRGWIGLYREDDSSPWKWSRGDEKANYTFFDPSELDSKQNCAFKYPNYDTWWNGPCTVDHSFICYDETLVLVKENKTWEEALDHCRSLRGVDTSTNRDHRYDLVTLSSEFDHSFARSEAREATTDEVWTGLRFLAGEWLWVSGEQVKYDNIQRCEADRFCGVLERKNTSFFGTRSCNERRNFFCQKRL
ncbi:macrophage mannose receptor 1-like [Mugil cephalus]|uniref:macrophage mannose receptor 1-like n=1 Tax=Mugil cephalus TaxID=48193 RepID=UPI001FB7DAF8|nr:macrophage mannose receptor 1-like [Mugil cephalus]XP_047428346.1 macrophage mannose receptor 1-like [Mugil cephalus]